MAPNPRQSISQPAAVAVESGGENFGSARCMLHAHVYTYIHTDMRARAGIYSGSVYKESKKKKWVAGARKAVSLITRRSAAAAVPALRLYRYSATHAALSDL